MIQYNLPKYNSHNGIAALYDFYKELPEEQAMTLSRHLFAAEEAIEEAIEQARRFRITEGTRRLLTAQMTALKETGRVGALSLAAFLSYDGEDAMHDLRRFLLSLRDEGRNLPVCL